MVGSKISDGLAEPRLVLREMMEAGISWMLVALMTKNICTACV